MLDLIKDNFFRASGNGPSWKVEIDPPRRKIKSYFEESCISANEIYSNKTGHLYLLFSGGLDSQYVFNIFKRLKFNFTPIIIRLQGRYHNEDYNAHESKYAIEECQRNNVDPLIIKFDFDKFLESGELFEICNEIQLGHHHLAMRMKLITMIDGFVVQGDGEPYLVYDKDDDTWKILETEIAHSLLNFHKIKNIPGCPFFLSYTPEMFLSFLTDPIIIDLANKKYPGKLSSDSSKGHIYNRNSNFNLIPYNYQTKVRIKHTGFELIDSSPLMEHPAMIEYQNIREKWNGSALLGWHQLVDDLSIYQKNYN
jgi:hypothetical protein